jgi:hypothetical protein
MPETNKTPSAEELMDVIRTIWPYVRRPPMTFEQPAFEAAIDKVRAVAPDLTKNC